MQTPSHLNAKRKLLDILSLVFFSIFAVIFAWSLYMIIPGYLPHNADSLDGLVSFLGFILMGISMIPLVLGILSRSSYKKLTNEMQTLTTTSYASNDSAVMTPRDEIDVEVAKRVN